MFETEPGAILIPAQPFRPLVFGEYRDRGTERKLFEGEYIDSVCRDGTDPYLHYVVWGCMGAEYLREDGSTLMLYKRSSGNAFQGEFAGIASLGSARLRFVALANSVVVSFTYDQTYQIVRENPAAFQDLVYITHVSFGQLGHRLENVGAQSSSRRIIVWLKKLMDVSRPDRDGRYRIPCAMTMQDLSDLLLMHVTTCSRLVSALKSRGIIDRTGKYIVILDPAELDRLALQENPVLY